MRKLSLKTLRWLKQRSHSSKVMDHRLTLILVWIKFPSLIFTFHVWEVQMVEIPTMMVLEVWSRIWKEIIFSLGYHILVRLITCHIWMHTQCEKYEFARNNSAGQHQGTFISFRVLLNLREYNGRWKQWEKKPAFVEYWLGFMHYGAYLILHLIPQNSNPVKRSQYL